MKAAKKLHENQARVEQLTKDWTEKWKEAKSIMQVGGVGWALIIMHIFKALLLVVFAFFLSCFAWGNFTSFCK